MVLWCIGSTLRCLRKERGSTPLGIVLGAWGNGSPPGCVPGNGSSTLPALTTAPDRPRGALSSHGIIKQASCWCNGNMAASQAAALGSIPGQEKTGTHRLDYWCKGKHACFGNTSTRFESWIVPPFLPAPKALWRCTRFVSGRGRFDSSWGLFPVQRLLCRPRSYKPREAVGFRPGLGFLVCFLP
jgi:hypothetical protein